jgi:hypothetical protein
MTRPIARCVLEKVLCALVPFYTVWGAPGGDDGGVEGRNRSFPQRGGH